MGFYADQVFPRFYDRMIKRAISDEDRARVLKEAEGEILEVGIGTGVNLPFYPPHVLRIRAVDPNPGMERELKRKLPERRLKVDFALAGVEKLPFDDGSFQTVVSTLTMCSIPDLAEALREMRRVLRPGGKLIFTEHGLSPDPWAARFQRALNPLWKKVACGCRLDVDVPAELKKARFDIPSLRTYYLPNAPKFVGHVYEGLAVRGSALPEKE